MGKERRGGVHGLGLGPSSLASLSSNQFGDNLAENRDSCKKGVNHNKRLEDEVTRFECRVRPNDPRYLQGQGALGLGKNSLLTLNLP